MTGKDLIKWIHDNNAEDLPVMIRREKGKPKEYVNETDLEITVKIAENENQLQYKKYFLI